MGIGTWGASPVGRARLAVNAFFVLAGLAFISWAVRIADVKSPHGVDDATLGGALLGTAWGVAAAMWASSDGGRHQVSHELHGTHRLIRRAFGILRRLSHRRAPGGARQ